MLTQQELKIVDYILINGSTTHKELSKAVWHSNDYLKRNCAKVVFFRVRKKLSKIGINFVKRPTGDLKELRYIPEDILKLFEEYGQRVMETHGEPSARSY